MSVKEKYTQVKTHVAENKTTYLGVAGGAVLGAAGLFLATGGVVQIVDAFKIQIASPTTNNVTTILVRRGHPGYIVKCLETGEMFASQNRAASANGVSAANLSQHLNGLQDQVSGLHFERVGEAA